MSHCVHFLVCAAVIILQTGIFPHIPLLDRSYDLLVPFIIYLGLFRPVPEGLITLVLLGVLMDGLSGGAFGLYLSAYLWIYLGSIWTVRYLHLVNSILLPFVVAGGVLFENLVFMAGAALGKSPIDINASILLNVMVQLLLAVLTGPFALLFFRGAYIYCERWAGRHLTRRNGASSP